MSCHRFEPDMLAFSGCYYGGGDEERTVLGALRKRWKSLHVNPLNSRENGMPSIYRTPGLTCLFFIA